ncbi:MAG TPA: BlaI/MecI/CopY family transcriptional regulator [Terriglobia bacterium]|jgi:BlaI family penicillinase repressor|nr:BlaI/MecI/CopY family transcriptional regulator [Terriglobia bacterium]
MTNAKGSPRAARPRNLSGVEQLVMDHIWVAGAVTAEAVREALAPRHAMKDSTVRTVLRRLEEKGYLRHKVEGRTFLYRAAHARQNIAARAVSHIADRFCGGSVEQLLVGMVENEVLDSEELQRLARKIAQKKEAKP